MLRKIALALSGILGLLLIGLAVTYLLSMPSSLPQDSSSAQWLQSGPFAVGFSDFVLVDESRETMHPSSRIEQSPLASGIPITKRETILW